MCTPVCGLCCLDRIFPNICLLILLFSPCLDCIFPLICLLILLFRPWLDCIFPNICLLTLLFSPCLDCIFPIICLLILLFSPCLACIFPNICLLLLLFSLCLHCSCQICVCCYCGSVSVCTVPAKYSSADTVVQPLFALFLSNIRLLILLFSLCLHCSCRTFVC